MVLFSYIKESKDKYKKEIVSSLESILSLVSFNKEMITLLTRIYKNISQQFYDDVINNIELSNLKCPYCNKHDLIKHCYYSRHYKQEGIDITIIILRVKCKNCKHTHALLLDSIVPYSQSPLIDQVDIIINQDNINHLKRIMEQNCLIDEGIISKIKFRYNKYYRKFRYCQVNCVSCYR